MGGHIIPEGLGGILKLQNQRLAYEIADQGKDDQNRDDADDAHALAAADGFRRIRPGKAACFMIGHEKLLSNQRDRRAFENPTIINYTIIPPGVQLRVP